VILTGHGDKAFCAGGDLKQRNGMTDEAWQAQHLVFERMLRALLSCPIPIIGAINGAAYGGGCEIAAALDFVYASTNARFALTEVTLGIMPGGGGTQNLPRAVGERRAKELILSGMPFSAAEAEQWGLVNRIAAPGELDHAVGELADLLLAKPSAVLAAGKQFFYRQIEMDMAPAYKLASDVITNNMLGQDALEGVNAFVEKRAPNWHEK